MLLVAAISAAAKAARGNVFRVFTKQLSCWGGADAPFPNVSAVATGGAGSSDATLPMANGG
jgi:hypothetical protein